MRYELAILITIKPIPRRPGARVLAAHATRIHFRRAPFALLLPRFLHPRAGTRCPSLTRALSYSGVRANTSYSGTTIVVRKKRKIVSRHRHLSKNTTNSTTPIEPRRDYNRGSCRDETLFRDTLQDVKMLSAPLFVSHVKFTIRPHRRGSKLSRYLRSHHLSPTLRRIFCRRPDPSRSSLGIVKICAAILLSFSYLPFSAGLFSLSSAHTRIRDRYKSNAVPRIPLVAEDRSAFGPTIRFSGDDNGRRFNRGHLRVIAICAFSHGHSELRRLFPQ